LAPGRDCEPSKCGHLEPDEGTHGGLVRFGRIGAVRLRPLGDNETHPRLQQERYSNVEKVCHTKSAKCISPHFSIATRWLLYFGRNSMLRAAPLSNA
jgi:hypothetical protein